MKADFKADKKRIEQLENKIEELTYVENWKTLQPGVFYRKVGTDVEVRFDIENLNKTINGYANTSFGMMPEGYRPSEPVRIAVFSINTAGIYPLHILINPTYYNGYVNLYNPYANNLTIKQVYGFVKYSIL